MKTTQSMTSIRFGVLLSMLSLIAIVVLFELGIRLEWTTLMLIVEIPLLVILLISFILSFMRTGLWKFTHRPLKDLDEREIALTSKSLRQAYAWFAIIVLCILLVFAVFNIAVSIVLAVSLILFAHLIPGAVIAMTEKTLRF
ncbi:MAG: hypothetical protein KAT14_00920 [Candidatus Marinimicrobia bacterium]|nr:hypothetical protein [Candidatus Neomarinimicrobiota bacterium]